MTTLTVEQLCRLWPISNNSHFIENATISGRLKIVPFVQESAKGTQIRLIDERSSREDKHQYTLRPQSFLQWNVDYAVGPSSTQAQVLRSLSPSLLECLESGESFSIIALSPPGYPGRFYTLFGSLPSPDNLHEPEASDGIALKLWERLIEQGLANGEVIKFELYDIFNSSCRDLIEGLSLDSISPLSSNSLPTVLDFSPSNVHIRSFADVKKIFFTALMKRNLFDDPSKPTRHTVAALSLFSPLTGKLRTFHCLDIVSDHLPISLSSPLLSSPPHSSPPPPALDKTENSDFVDLESFLFDLSRSTPSQGGDHPSLSLLSRQPSPDLCERSVLTQLVSILLSHKTYFLSVVPSLTLDLMETVLGENRRVYANFDAVVRTLALTERASLFHLKSSHQKKEISMHQILNYHRQDIKNFFYILPSFSLSILPLLVDAKGQIARPLRLYPTERERERRERETALRAGRGRGEYQKLDQEGADIVERTEKILRDSRAMIATILKTSKGDVGRQSARQEPKERGRDTGYYVSRPLGRDKFEEIERDTKPETELDSSLDRIDRRERRERRGRRDSSWGDSDVIEGAEGEIGELESSIPPPIPYTSLPPTDAPVARKSRTEASYDESAASTCVQSHRNRVGALAVLKKKGSSAFPLSLASRSSSNFSSQQKKREERRGEEKQERKDEGEEERRGEERRGEEREMWKSRCEEMTKEKEGLLQQNKKLQTLLDRCKSTLEILQERRRCDQAVQEEQMKGLEKRILALKETAISPPSSSPIPLSSPLQTLQEITEIFFQQMNSRGEDWDVKSLPGGRGEIGEKRTSLSKGETDKKIALLDKKLQAERKRNLAFQKIIDSGNEKILSLSEVIKKKEKTAPKPRAVERQTQTEARREEERGGERRGEERRVEERKMEERRGEERREKSVVSGVRKRVSEQMEMALMKGDPRSDFSRRELMEVKGYPSDIIEKAKMINWTIFNDRQTAKPNACRYICASHIIGVREALYHAYTTGQFEKLFYVLGRFESQIFILVKALESMDEKVNSLSRV